MVAIVAFALTPVPARAGFDIPGLTATWDASGDTLAPLCDRRVEPDSEGCAG